jgi:uncharacterized protein YegJ (DUF2314 family)
MLCLLLCAILFFSCDKPGPDVSGNPAATIELEQTDEEIERIAENARRTLTIFLRNLARPEAGAGNFCVKYPLIADDGSRMEQVWLANIHLKDGLYYGILANTTIRLDSIHKGDTINFEPDAITDWMYIQDGKIIGGRSIKYILEMIPENERSVDQWKILQMFD